MLRSSISLTLILAVMALLSTSVLGAPAASSDFVKQNGLDAQKLNAQFATLKASDTCNEGQQACVEQAFAQCVSGKWELTKCAAGTVCTALPLVNSAGTSLACDSEADAVARLQAAGVDASLTGNGNSTVVTASSTTDAGATPTTSSNAPNATSSSSTDNGDDDCSDDGEDNSSDSNSSSPSTSASSVNDDGDDQDCEGDDDSSVSSTGAQATSSAAATFATGTTSSAGQATQVSAAANSLGAATPSTSASADSNGYAYAASSPSDASQVRAVAPAATTIALNKREAFVPVKLFHPQTEHPAIPSVRRYLHRASQLVRRQSAAQSSATPSGGALSPSAAIIELTGSLPTSFVSASGVVAPSQPSAPASAPVVTPFATASSSAGVVTVTVVSTITVFAPSTPTSSPSVPVVTGTAIASGLPAFSSPATASAASSSPTFIGIPPSNTPVLPSTSVTPSAPNVPFSNPVATSTPVFGGATPLPDVVGTVIPSSPISSAIPASTAVRPSSVLSSPPPVVTPTALPVDPVIPTNSAAFFSMLTATI